MSIESLCGADFTCPGNTYCGTNYIDIIENILLTFNNEKVPNQLLWFGNVIVGERSRDV